MEGDVSEPVSGGSDDSAASSPFSDLGGAFSPPASSRVNDSKADTSSPSSTITAIGFLSVSNRSWGLNQRNEAFWRTTYVSDCYVFLA